MEKVTLRKDTGWRVAQCDGCPDSNYLITICPKCATKATLIPPRFLPKGSHRVEEDGSVYPSCVCINTDCDWHEWVKLKGWHERVLLPEYYTISVNCLPHKIFKDELSYEEICKIAYPARKPDLLHTVVYSSEYSEGSLTPGQKVKLFDKMLISASLTNNA